MTPSRFNITKYSGIKVRYGTALNLAMLPVLVFIGPLTVFLHLIIFDFGRGKSDS